MVEAWTIVSAMRTLVTTSGKTDSTELDEVNRCFDAAHKEGLWLDIENHAGADYKLLEEPFKAHELRIEGIQDQNKRRKSDEYPEYNFVVIFQADWQGDDVSFVEHHLFVGPTYLITVHNEPAPVLTELQDRIHKSPALTKGQPAFLTYLVVDALVDATFPVLERVDETVDKMEDEITQKAAPGSLDRIYHLKHSMTELRRYLGAQRDVFQKLITHGIHLQQQDMTLYYRDVYDHIVRQYETVDSLRDLLSSAMDVYLSTVSNRLNQTTKALTVIASLFFPLSFLTGFYGMNFSYLTPVPEPSYCAFPPGTRPMLL